MPRKKAANARPSFTDTLDKLLAEVQPELAAAMSLAAVAGYYGITPPLTSILYALRPDYQATKEPTELERARDYWKAANDIVDASATQWYNWISSGFSHNIIPGEPSSTPKPKTEAQNMQELRYAKAAMAAVEVYLMSRPGVMSAVIEAPAKMVSAIGEIVPG